MQKNDKNRVLKNAGLLTEAEYDFSIDLPSDVLVLFNIFKKHGKKLYVVGGAVRDALLGKTPKDFDVVTDALPDDIENILSKENIYNFPSGKNFGIISAVLNDETYEIASFRSDNYLDSADGRRPTSVTFGDIKGDAFRRDLTINALYYDIESKKIIDLVGGVEDLKNKKIKPVGNAHDRFSEDRLRSLRVLRFSHRFGSTLDNETIQAIIHFKDLSGVSNERIRDEFNKALHSSQHPEYFLEEFLSLGLGPRTFGNVELDTSHAPDLRNPVLVLAKLLWKNVDQEIRKCLLNFKSPSDEIDAVVFLKNIVDRFKNFDKLVFDPQIDGKWLLILNRAKNLMLKRGVLTEGDIQLWSQIMGLNGHLIKTFIDFEPIYSGSDFPEMKQGKELGEKISVENAKHFLKNL